MRLIVCAELQATQNISCSVFWNADGLRVVLGHCGTGCRLGLGPHVVDNGLIATLLSYLYTPEWNLSMVETFKKGAASISTFKIKS